jgi:hypothetical protein
MMIGGSIKYRSVLLIPVDDELCNKFVRQRGSHNNAQAMRDVL